MKRENPIKSKYANWLKRAKDTRNYFSFFRPYCLVMSRLDALFFQDLWNLASIPGIKTQKFNGRTFFLCTTQFLLDSQSQWTAKEQKPRFRSLLKSKFIRVEKKGLPPRRWVRIEIEVIEKALDDALQSVPYGTDCSGPDGTEQQVPTGTGNNKEGKNKHPLKGKERKAFLPGFHQLPKDRKKKRFDGQDLEYARRFVRLNRKFSGERNVPLDDKTLFPFASAFSAMAFKMGREGYRRIDRFMSAWEQGGTTFKTISSTTHFRRLMVIWEDVEKKKNPRRDDRSHTEDLGNGRTRTTVIVDGLAEIEAEAERTGMAAYVEEE